nr:hypothetical protein CFP56_36191 [Quercus suber]
MHGCKDAATWWKDNKGRNGWGRTAPDGRAEAVEVMMMLTGGECGGSERSCAPGAHDHDRSPRRQSWHGADGQRTFAIGHSKGKPVDARSSRRRGAALIRVLPAAHTVSTVPKVPYCLWDHTSVAAPGRPPCMFTITEHAIGGRCVQYEDH